MPMIFMLCRALCKRSATRRPAFAAIADLSSRQRDFTASFFEDSAAT
jgi:hypothetical protein